MINGQAFKLICMMWGILFILHGCEKLRNTNDDAIPNNIGELQQLDEGLNFLIVGDWGREGNHGQNETAFQMGITAETLSADFVISTGDNFYGAGVSSISDPLWPNSFIQVYDNASLQIPWYVVLGNHDYDGNIEAQIAATNIIPRWNLPAHYYRQLMPLEQGDTALLLFLDTNPLHDPYYNNPNHKVLEQDSTVQLLWVDSLLTTHANARWKIVVGHHPCYTSGKRVDNVPHVRHHLEPLFKKHAVDAYFCGHEHDLQHQKPDGVTHYFVSGAGSKVRETGSIDITLFSKSISGFMAASLNSDTLKIQAVDHFGNILYHYNLVK